MVNELDIEELQRDVKGLIDTKRLYVKSIEELAVQTVILTKLETIETTLNSVVPTNLIVEQTLDQINEVSDMQNDLNKIAVQLDSFSSKVFFSPKIPLKIDQLADNLLSLGNKFDAECKSNITPQIDCLHQDIQTIIDALEELTVNEFQVENIGETLSSIASQTKKVAKIVKDVQKQTKINEEITTSGTNRVSYWISRIFEMFGSNLFMTNAQYAFQRNMSTISFPILIGIFTGILTTAITTVFFVLLPPIGKITGTGTEISSLSKIRNEVSRTNLSMAVNGIEKKLEVSNQLLTALYEVPNVLNSNRSPDLEMTIAYDDKEIYHNSRLSGGPDSEFQSTLNKLKDNSVYFCLIEAHASSSTIKNKNDFNSNFELASARAMNVKFEILKYSKKDVSYKFLTRLKISDNQKANISFYKIR